MTQDILENYFENEPIDEIAINIECMISDNEVYDLTLALFHRMDSTHKKQFIDAVIEKGLIR